MTDFIDNTAKEVFGMTRTSAILKDICIYCKKPVNITTISDIDLKEYKLSALCGVCFDSIAGEGKKLDVDIKRVK